VTENKNSPKKRRIGLWIFIVVLVVVGLLVGWRILRNRRDAAATLANLETEPYQRSTLSANIFGTGTVRPDQTANLTWAANGNVGEVRVSLGQAVAKDEILMTLDPDSVSVDILQAQIDVINAQNALDDLYDNLGVDLAQAKLDLLNAEEALEDLQTERAIMNYQRCTDERIEELEDDLEWAEQLYKFRQTADNLRAINTAQANLNYCRADFSEREIAEAELQIELGEARVVDSQAKVDLLMDGPDPDKVTILETQLAMAQSRLDSLSITAPFAGVVTVISSQAGDVVQVGSQALQLDQLNALFLDVQISEIDISLVRLGQPVSLVFDAYFEETFTGEVIEIAPVGQTVQGVVEYSVRIKMLDADERILPGMTAAVTIVVAEKEDVFVIPNNAIVAQNGQDFVYVRRNGSYEEVPVVLGSYSEFYSEVLDADIAEGELIVLNPPNEVTGQMPFGGPPGGGFGGFGN